MRREVKALLDPVVAALNKGDFTAKELWSILSALRGPDGAGDDVFKLKMETTARLRYAIGIRPDYLGGSCAVEGQALISDGQLPTGSEYVKLFRFDDPLYHFKSHFYLALSALEREDT